jgi:acyl dehydratase
MSDDRRLRAEALPVGETIALGEYYVSQQEIIDFAAQWDPQLFHIDPAFARATTFGGLIGSGLHTMAIYQRLAVIGAYRHWAVVAGRSVRDIEFTSPLRPDTTVSASVRIDSVSPVSDDHALVMKTGKVLHGDRVLMRLQVDAYALRQQAVSPS